MKKLEVKPEKALPKGNENTKPFWLTPYAGLIVSGVAIFLWITFAFSPRPDILYQFELRTDRFSAFEALMSALALVGLIFALAVQQHELKMQQAELRLTNAQAMQQTEIFRTENLERRIVQALEQFQEFQRNVDFTAGDQEVKDSKALGIPREIEKGQNVGKELAGSLSRVCLSRVLLADATGSDLNLDDLRKRLLANEISFYGGSIHPLVKRVRLILLVIHRLKSELLEFAENAGEFNTNPEGHQAEQTEVERKIEAANQAVEYYSTLLREELKPDQHALIALCALFNTPYDDLGNLVESTSFLDDFNWLWADILFNGNRETYLRNSKPLSCESQQTLKKLGLQVLTKKQEVHATTPLKVRAI